MSLDEVRPGLASLRAERDRAEDELCGGVSEERGRELLEEIERISREQQRLLAALPRLASPAPPSAPVTSATKQGPGSPLPSLGGRQPAPDPHRGSARTGSRPRPGPGPKGPGLPPPARAATPSAPSPHAASRIRPSQEPQLRGRSASQGPGGAAPSAPSPQGLTSPTSQSQLVERGRSASQGPRGRLGRQGQPPSAVAAQTPPPHQPGTHRRALAPPEPSQKLDPDTTTPSPSDPLRVPPGPTPPGGPEPGNGSEGAHAPSDAAPGPTPEPSNGSTGEEDSDDSDASDSGSNDPNAGDNALRWPQLPVARRRLDAAALSTVHHEWGAVFDRVCSIHDARPWPNHEHAHRYEAIQLRVRCSPHDLVTWQAEPSVEWIKAIHDMPGGTPLPLYSSVVASSLARHLVGKDVSVLYIDRDLGRQQRGERNLEATVLFSSKFDKIGGKAQAIWDGTQPGFSHTINKTTLSELHSFNGPCSVDSNLGHFPLPDMPGVRFYRGITSLYIWVERGYCDISFPDTWFPPQRNTTKHFIPSPLRLAAAVALFLVLFYKQRVFFVYDGKAYDVVECTSETSVVLLRTSQKVETKPPTPTASAPASGKGSKTTKSLRSGSTSTTGKSSSQAARRPTTKPSNGTSVATSLTTLVQAWREEVELASRLESAVAALRRSGWATKEIARAAGYNEHNGARDIKAMLNLRCKDPSQRLEQLLRARVEKDGADSDGTTAAVVSREESKRESQEVSPDRAECAAEGGATPMDDEAPVPVSGTAERRR